MDRIWTFSSNPGYPAPSIRPMVVVGSVLPTPSAEDEEICSLHLELWEVSRKRFGLQLWDSTESPGLDSSLIGLKSTTQKLSSCVAPGKLFSLSESVSLPISETTVPWKVATNPWMHEFLFAFWCWAGRPCGIVSCKVWSLGLNSARSAYKDVSPGSGLTFPKFYHLQDVVVLIFFQKACWVV